MILNDDNTKYIDELTVRDWDNLPKGLISDQSGHELDRDIEKLFCV